MEYKHKFLTIVIMAFVGSFATAERCPNVTCSIGPGGSLELPPQIVGLMVEGRLSNYCQFAVLKEAMACYADKVIATSKVTGKDTAAKARAVFERAKCLTMQGWKNALIYSMLPGMSSNARLGGSQSPQQREWARGMAWAIMSALMHSGDCEGGKATNKGFSGNLFKILKR